MQGYAGQQDHESPENLIGRVAHRLRNHALWDSLLIFSPPLLAILYLIGILHPFASLPRIGVLVLAVGAIAVGLLAVMLRFRPSLPAVARLVDDKVGAEDRFITLATLGTTPASEVFIDRLRREAAGMANRIEIRRDFPYVMKRSFFWSLSVSVVAVALFHLLLISSEFTRPSLSPQQRIRDLAEKMMQSPPLAEIGRDLHALATQLENPQVSPQEQQSIIQEMQKEVAQQQKKEQQQDNKDLLSDAGSTLKSLEQESGGETQQEQQKDGGGVQNNASQEGQGEGKQSQGSSGDTKGEVTAQLNPEMKDGKSTQGDPQGQGQQKNSRTQNEQKADPPDPSNSDKTNSNEFAGKMQDDSEGKSAKNRSGAMPQDERPAERYYQPDEQAREGIKGARYVTVQLPEEVAADGNGVATASKDGKESRNRPRLPVSNVPLPAHIPDAPAENQRMPLEYRDLIR